MLTIAVCDDEKMIVNQMEEIILKTSIKYKIPVETEGFYSGESLKTEILKGKKYDLIYLEIQLKGENGIALAQKIREVDENVLFIYVSDYEKIMRELFRLRVFDFINKPVNENHFIQIFLEANEKICQKKAYFKFQYKKEESKELFSDILYFESKGRQVYIYLNSGRTAKFNSKISDVENKLKGSKIPFLRVHQSYLINYHFIQSRTKSNVVLANGVKLPVSEKKQKRFAKEYETLLEEIIE